MSGPAWLTTTQAGVVLGVTTATVWRWAHSKVIPPNALLHVGRHVRVARWWAEGRQPGSVEIHEMPYQAKAGGAP